MVSDDTGRGLDFRQVFPAGFDELPAPARRLNLAPPEIRTMTLTSDTAAPNTASIDTGMSSDLARAVQQKFGTLPMVPGTAAKALQVAQNPECTVAEFANLIETDVKLASEILAHANSVRFACNTPAKNLPAAIVRLGFEQCRHLILTCSAVALMRKLSSGQTWIAETLSRHSFVTALSATYINRGLGFGFHGEEFTAGLIHDLGRLILASCLPEEYTQVDPLDWIESADILQREQQAFHTDHTVVGSWYLLKNNLPNELIEVVRLHHSPQEAKICPPLVALIAVADDMANYMHQRQSSAGYSLRERPVCGVFQQVFSEAVAAQLEPLAHELLDAAWHDSNQVFTE
jgi:HD-like signal output (HDOD) protein